VHGLGDPRIPLRVLTSCAPTPSLEKAVKL